MSASHGNPRNSKTPRNRRCDRPGCTRVFVAARSRTCTMTCGILRQALYLVGDATCAPIGRNHGEDAQYALGIATRMDRDRKLSKNDMQWLYDVRMSYRALRTRRDPEEHPRG